MTDTKADKKEEPVEEQNWRLGEDAKGKVTLRFTYYAWQKLVFIRDYCETEVACYGVTCPDDHLLVHDLYIPEQFASTGRFEMDPEDVGRWVEEMNDHGLEPYNLTRVWIHTHPGNSPEPSPTDLETWSETFGNFDWAIMYIIAKGGATHCRIRSNSMVGDRKVYLEQKLTHQFFGLGQTPLNHDQGILLTPDEWMAEVDQQVKPFPKVVHATNYGGYAVGGKWSAYDERQTIWAEGEWDSKLDGWIPDPEVQKAETEEEREEREAKWLSFGYVKLDNGAWVEERIANSVRYKDRKVVLCQKIIIPDNGEGEDTPLGKAKARSAVHL